MEYLMQFQIIDNKTEFDDPIEFHHKDFAIKLYFLEKNWISFGKKAHIIIEAPDWHKALNIYWSHRIDLVHRLMFALNEPVILDIYPELILENQAGKVNRNIRFWDLDFPRTNYLDSNYFHNVDILLNREIIESDVLAIGYYDEALQSKLLSEQFRSLYLALEEVIGSSDVQKRCEKCGANLNPKVSNEQIDTFFSGQEKDISIFGNYDYPKGAELRKIRGKLSHPANKRGIIKEDLLKEKVKLLSRLIRCHLETKYNLEYTAFAISKPMGSSMDFLAIFKTEHPSEKFALDIPPTEEYINRISQSRWVFPSKKQ
jgi:hypothetical protein